MRGLLLAVLLAIAGLAGAAEPVRPFVAGSLAQILAAHEGRPFILAFWSVACAHCPAELKTLGRLKRRHPALEVVLVAADTPEDAPRTARLAAEYGLGKVEQWVFADPVPERLRFEIDRRWHGELPRTHFYDREHRREAKSGVVDAGFLAAWMTRNGIVARERR